MIKLVWIYTVVMCLSGGQLEGQYLTYVIEHDDKMTYFKLNCPEDDYKLATENIPNGVTYVKEFPNEIASFWKKREYGIPEYRSLDKTK